MGIKSFGWAGCALSLLTVWLCVWGRVAPSHAVDPTEEVHHYQEITGKSVKDVEWRLRKGDTLTLTYKSPGEQHVTTTCVKYDTLRWKVIADNGQTEFLAERTGKTIVVRGMFKGAPVKKAFEIDEAPWYQATSLSLRELVASNDSERIFWTIRYDTLSVHKIKASKEDVEIFISHGVARPLQRIRLNLLGLMAPFWKSDYWFSLPDGVFFRFEGPSGLPGSPMTMVNYDEG